MKASFTGQRRAWVRSLSYLEKVEPTAESALIGFINNITVIIMLKICKLFPDMYIIIAFMGMAFAGAKAISHAFLRNKSSVSLALAGVAATAPPFADFCKCQLVDSPEPPTPPTRSTCLGTSSGRESRRVWDRRGDGARLVAGKRTEVDDPMGSGRRGYLWRMRRSHFGDFARYFKVIRVVLGMSLVCRS